MVKIDLSERVALVTGGGNGIGLGIARALSRAGAMVAVAGRNLDKLGAAVKELEQYGDRVLAVPADVSDPAAVDRLVAQVIEFGGRIDILVNNAGQILKSNVVDTVIGDWDNIINVNLRGTFLCTQAALPGMIAQKFGRVINISSTGGKRGFPRTTAYCASKFGISGFSEALAQEVAEYGITVASICPGLVDTAMAREAMPGADTTDWIAPDDIGEVVAFLASRPSGVLIPEVMVLAAKVDYWRQ